MLPDRDGTEVAAFEGNSCVKACGVRDLVKLTGIGVYLSQVSGGSRGGADSATSARPGLSRQ